MQGYKETPSILQEITKENYRKNNQLERWNIKKYNNLKIIFNFSNSSLNAEKRISKLGARGTLKVCLSEGLRARKFRQHV